MMQARSLRWTVLAFVSFPLMGCDSNPDGPSAPTTAAPVDPNAPPPPPSAGVKPKGKGSTKGHAGVAPATAD